MAARRARLLMTYDSISTGNQYCTAMRVGTGDVLYSIVLHTRVCACAVRVVRASIYDTYSRICLSRFYCAGVRAQWSPNSAFLCIEKMWLILLLYCALHGVRKTMSCFIQCESTANSEKQF